jgi:putative transposase
MKARKRTTQRQGAVQGELRFGRNWGGRREGAGRKKGRRSGVAHRTRPVHKGRHPVHVTLRARRQLPSLRKQVLFIAIRRAFGKTARSWFRIVHFSVQQAHVHLLVEADDKTSLTRGLMEHGLVGCSERPRPSTDKR